MDFSRFYPRLKQIQLFRDLTESDLSRVISSIQELSIETGHYLIKEGEPGRDLFFIEEGEVEVLKKNPTTEEEVLICVVGKKKLLGEMALLEAGHREASIRALKPTRLLVISLHLEENDPLYLKIKSRLSDLLAMRVKEGNRTIIQEIAENLEHVKARVAIGNLIVYLMALIFLYLYAIQILAILRVNVISSSFISIPILAFFAISMMVLIKSSGYPLSLYGFNLKGARRAVIEAMIFCVPIFAIIVLMKWAVIHYLPAFHHLKLFHVSPALESSAPSVSTPFFIFLVSLYALFVPIQEFIFRGAIQSSLQQFLLGKHKTLQAVLISNLPFSMIHLHLSFSLTILVYLIGLIWGAMYARQKTLIGCCVSHFFIGLWAFFIVGIQDFLVV